jgi:hypothetical protein
LLTTIRENRQSYALTPQLLDTLFYPFCKIKRLVRKLPRQGEKSKVELSGNISPGGSDQSPAFPAAEISTEDLRLLEFSRALYAASNLEIDAVINPVDSRKTNAQVLESA